MLPLSRFNEFGNNIAFFEALYRANITFMHEYAYKKQKSTIFNNLLFLNALGRFFRFEKLTDINFPVFEI